MKKLSEFVSQHLDDNITRLILDRAKWPDIDIDAAVNCIESRRKLKGKVQEWYENPSLVFPLKLSAEQCSSSATARYKATLAESIASCAEWKIADLTGGLGVDSWFFSKKASQVLYNEMQKTLCEAASYNFRILESDNIIVSNHAVVPDESLKDDGNLKLSPAELFNDFIPDVIYMDPARRSETGKKVFLIEDCTPDVIQLKDELFRICRHLLIKLSPMADITMVCSRLGNRCREVHIVSAGGECKELLIWMDREWNSEYTITAVEAGRNENCFSFRPSEEKLTTPDLCTISDMQDGYLFEPGKSLMKAGAFNLISRRLGIGKAGISTHYYITTDSVKAEGLKGYGKVFSILRVSSLDKRSIRSVGEDYPNAEVTARNIQMDTDTLRKKLGTRSGDRYHIFGIRSDKEGPLLLVTEVMR